MGILDELLNNDSSRTALGLLAAAGPSATPQSFGQRLMGGLLQSQEIGQRQQDQKAAQQYRAMQMQQMALQYQQAQQAAKQAELDRTLTQTAFTPVKPIEANQASGIAGPRPEALGVVGQQPAFDPRQFIASGGSAPLAFQIEQSMRKDNTPVKLGAGEALFDPRTFKQIANNPKEQDLPSAIKEYQFAVQQGYKGSLQDFLLEQKRAGASSVSVSMDKGFGTTFAEQAAKDLAASRDKARGAVSTISTLNNIDRLIDTGKVATGPTQPFQVFGMQMADALGMGGKNNAEKLANTRQVIQGAAMLAMDGAKMMAGQGQITEAERALIGRAAGGDIDKLTAPEMKALTGALRKVNSAAVSSHQSLLSNVGPQFKQFTPFYEVQTPSAGDGWSIKPVGSK